MHSGIPAAHYASLGVGLFLLALSIVTWRRAPRVAVNVTFLACFGLLAGYELTEGAFRTVLFHTGQMILPLHYANNALIVLVTPAFLHFCSEFPRRGSFPRWAITGCYITCLALSALCFSDAFITDRRAVFVQELGGFVFERRFGPLFAPVNGVATVVAAAALLELMRKLRGAHSATERTQLQFLLLGTAGTAGSLLLTGLLLPVAFDSYSFIPLGNLAPLLLCASTAYALSTQGMFDIADTLIRSALALLVPFTALASAGLFLRFVYGGTISALPAGFLAVAAVAVFAAQLALLRLLPSLTVLFPRQSQGPSDSAFDRVAADLLLLRSGNEALLSALLLARSTLGSVSAALFAAPLRADPGRADSPEADTNAADSAFDLSRATIVSTPGFFQNPPLPAALCAVLPKEGIGDPLYFDMLPEVLHASVLLAPESARAFVREHDVALAAPLGSVRVGGALFLGKRADGRAYLPEEVRQLGRIARALGIALENQANHGTLLEVRKALRRENAALADFSSRLSDRITGGGDTELIYGTGLMKEALATANRVATTDASIVLIGETGTGKELVAEYIHKKSNRARGPLVRVNCAAIPEALIENELFGHERGAFTGADRLYRGRFELAHKGTLFLDEIGELPLQLQPKLLRVLQERRFERLGAETTTEVDVRFVFATHQDLEQMVREGTFRSDLFYRINVITVRIPPLRERLEDLPLLVREFAARFAAQHGLPEPDVPEQTLGLLATQQWQGNIRQLQNIVLRSALSTEGSYDPVVVASLLAEESGRLGPPSETKWTVPAAGPVVPASGSLKDMLLETERGVIAAALRDTDGNKAEAARRLGLHPPSLIRKIRKLGLEERGDG